MISARKAWKMSKQTSYDESVYIDIMWRIESEIKFAANRGDTCIRQKLDYYISKERLLPTYYKVLKWLKKKKYKASLQNEIYDYVRGDKLAALNPRRAEVLRLASRSESGTYLYISWERKKK